MRPRKVIWGIKQIVKVSHYMFTFSEKIPAPLNTKLQNW
jgi:hypothetical protein